MEPKLDLMKLLSLTGLTQKFPEGLKREDIHSVTLYKTCDQSNADTMFHYSRFLFRIVHNDANCRFIYRKYNNSDAMMGIKEGYRRARKHVYVHPIDISTVIFLCCDYIARQNLVQHFWVCKHAFPLVIKTDHSKPPVIYIWPLKGICFTTTDSIEKHILRCNLKTVCALRFSKQNVSKSNILNIIFNKSEKVHSTFFHRNCDGSTSMISEVSEGMIEVSPLFDAKIGSMMLLNLRGNCNDHPTQRNFLSMFSVVVILVCKFDEQDLIKDFVHNTKSKFEKLIIVFTDDISPDNIDEHLLSRLDTFTVNLGVENGVIIHSVMTHSEFHHQIITHILATSRARTIEDLEQCARDNGIAIDLDKISGSLSKAETFSNEIIQTHKANKQLKMIFPIQGDECLLWAKADIEMYKLRHRKGLEPIRKYREGLERNKQELRCKQYQKIESSNFTEQFLDLLFLSETENISFAIFLRCLKLNFDHATCLHLSELYRQYESLKCQHKINQTDAKIIESQLNDIDEQINNSSLTVSIFSREMGQIYEALNSQDAGEDDLHFQWKGNRLPEAAVRLLLYGYEVEILDGRSNTVPVDWIKNIFVQLQHVLGNIRVKVVTVLGVQSSGKSTLLNAMFGSQFSVGSGRCTHGAHMYLSKVSEDVADNYSVDYFIIVDTEGLFSTLINWDEGSDRGENERALATFVIGLSHVTIINIMGEDLTYLRDLLPISVHAFLRMGLVGLSPKCKILHHNVHKVSREVLLRQQTYSLEKELDKHTNTACEIEKVSHRRFRDIIQFDITQDTSYFPTLLESLHDLEIISPSYSQEVMHFKDKLIEDTRATGTLHELIDHVWNLCNAIKRDNFVYEFRNTIEMEAMAYMGKKVCKLQWKCSREWQNLTADVQQQISNCSSIEELKLIHSNYKAQAKAMEKDQLKKNSDELSSGVQNRLLAKAFMNIKTCSENNLQAFINKRKTHSLAQIERIVNYTEREINITREEKLAISEIDDFINKNATVEKCPLNQSDIRNISNGLFIRWRDEVLSDNRFKQNIDYKFEDDAYDCIHTNFVSQRSYVDDLLRDKCIRERNLESFNLFLSSIDSASISRGEQDMLIEIMQDICRFVKSKALEIETMRAFYHAEIFTDIILEVQNHHYFNDGSFLVTHKFEIELAISSCGEFVEKLTHINKNSNVLPNRFIKNVEVYFTSKCNSMLESQSDIREIGQKLSSSLLQEVHSIILNNLHQDLADEMMNRHPTLKTKQGLVYFTWMGILEDNDILPIYLVSPELCLQRCLTQEFKEMFNNNDTLSKVVKKCSDRYLKIVCEKLINIQKTECSEEGMESMETCVRNIIKALETILPINDIRQFIHVRINNVSPKITIREIVRDLQEESNSQNLLSDIARSFVSKRYNKIRNQTVQILLENFTGCKESCPLCGELCCIVQENHQEMHKVLMHKPTGLKSPSSKLTSATCFEKMESFQEMDQSGPLAGWIIPTDVSAETNSFWKHVFVTFVINKTAQLDNEDPKDIPESWKRLTKAHERIKLSEYISKLTEI